MNAGPPLSCSAASNQHHPATSPETGNGKQFFHYGVAALLLCAALALRFHDFGREPLWFDEAASVNLSQGSLLHVITASANDSTPPLYFLGLYVWRTLFGSSDPALRAYGVLWSMAGLALVYAFARRARGPAAALAALALLAANPIDVYFAREVRMYAQAAVFSTASAWILWEWLTLAAGHRRRHLLGALYALSAFALLLTHYVGIAVLLAEGAVALALCLGRRNGRKAGEYLAWSAAVALAFAAWYFYLLRLRGGFNSANFSWMQHPPAAYYLNYLWHEFFWGRNALAQSRGWGWSLALVALTGALAAFAVWNAATSRSRQIIVYCALLLLTPPLIAGALGYLYQPVYNRERFATFLAPLFAVGVASALGALRSRTLFFATAGLLAGTMLIGSLWQIRAVKRTDWHAFAALWEAHKPEKVVFFPAYYDVPANRYVPQKLRTPVPHKLEEILPALEGKRIWAVLAHGHGFGFFPGEQDYYRRVTGLGSAQVLPFASDLQITQVVVGNYSVPDEYAQRFRIWTEPVDQAGRVEGFDRPGMFHALQTEPQGSRVRWSGPRPEFRIFPGEEAATVTLAVEWPPLSNGLSARFFVSRGLADGDKLFAQPSVHETSSPGGPGIQTIDLPVPAGTGPVTIGWESGTVNLKERGVSGDDRDLGLLLRWVGVHK